MATPQIARKSGQILVVSGPVTNQVTGATVASPDADDWAPSTASQTVQYARSQIAKVTASSVDYYMRCITPHAATSSDAGSYAEMSVTAGALVGTDRANWELVSGPGAVFRSLSASYAGARATEDTDYLEDSGTETTITSTSVTGTIEFIFDRNDQWHHLLDTPENEFTFRLFPDGPVTDGRFLSMRAQVDPSVTINKTRANTSISFASQGDVTRRKVVEADLIGLT